MALEIICSVFDAFTIAIYYHEMLDKHTKNIPNWLYWLCCILVQIFFFVLSTPLKNEYNALKMYINVAGNLIALFALSYLHSAHLSHRLFVIISFEAIASISEIAVYLLFVMLPSDVSKHLFENELYGSIASKIVTFLFLNLAIILRNRKKKHYPASYTFLILTTPIVTLILLMTIPGINNITHTQAVVSMVGMAGILAANIANYFLLNNIIKVNDLTLATTQLSTQLEYQAGKYQQISAAYRNSRSLIHDMKKHYFFIQDCIKHEKYDAILAYLEQSIHSIEDSYNRVNTGNLVIDAFVSNHLSLAEQENISFATDIRLVKEKIRMDDYDLCVILGNLLDNAHQACRDIHDPKPRQIMVQLFTTDHEFVIHIHNTLPGNQPGAKAVEKSDLVHGFGMKNVESVTLKYLGNYTHYEENERYHAIVSIPIIDKPLIP